MLDLHETQASKLESGETNNLKHTKLQINDLSNHSIDRKLQNWSHNTKDRNTSTS